MQRSLYIKNIFETDISARELYFSFLITLKLINIIVNIIAFEHRWKSWGLGEETKKIIIGADRINNNKK